MALEAVEDQFEPELELCVAVAAADDVDVAVFGEIRIAGSHRGDHPMRPLLDGVRGQPAIDRLRRVPRRRADRVLDEPDRAVAEWNGGKLDALIASTEKASGLMPQLTGAALSQLKSNEREKEQGTSYVLITR